VSLQAMACGCGTFEKTSAKERRAGESSILVPMRDFLGRVEKGKQISVKVRKKVDSGLIWSILDYRVGFVTIQDYGGENE
jgi:hypothetical protein